MVEYLNWKDESGLVDFALVSERKEVHLPSALEMSKADQSCLGSGAPNYLAVLAKFYAKQMAETNTRTTKVKHALARWDTDKQTIPFQKRTSEMIRDQYVTEIQNLFKSKEKEERTKSTKYVTFKRDPKLLKFSYEVHATPNLSMDFIKPCFRTKVLKA